MNRWTRLVQYDPAPGDPTAPTTTPLYQTSTFRQPSALGEGSHDYSRSGNPTRDVLEERLAELEEADHGFAFASGMAALSAITRLARAGDHIVACADLYGGTYRLLSKIVAHQGVDISFVDTTDLEALRDVLSDRTRLVLVETPSNPLLRVTDLGAVADLAHASGALLVVDNTIMSPWLQQPLKLGADVVVHSATKHLGGHGDLTAGAVVTNDPDVAETIGFVQNAEGTALSPFDSWLLLRGLKTLGLRVERQQDTAKHIARFLADHPDVTKVHFPGLEKHPGRAIHEEQARGPGLLVSFETGDVGLSQGIVEESQLFGIAVSFGSVHSTIGLPCAMSHASIPSAERSLPADLVRISVGIEDPDDLLVDLVQAFATVRRTLRRAAA